MNATRERKQAGSAERKRFLKAVKIGAGVEGVHGDAADGGVRFVFHACSAQSGRCANPARTANISHPIVCNKASSEAANRLSGMDAWRRARLARRLEIRDRFLHSFSVVSL
jgi:hypothetical protein